MWRRKVFVGIVGRMFANKEGRGRGGGLGIKYVITFNLALFSKWTWRILTNKEEIWRGISKHKYASLESQMLEGESSRVNNKDSYGGWISPC